MNVDNFGTPLWTRVSPKPVDMDGTDMHGMVCAATIEATINSDKMVYFLKVE